MMDKDEIIDNLFPEEILDTNHVLVGKRVEITLGPKSGIVGVVEGRDRNRRWRIRCNTDMGHSSMSFPKSHFKEIVSSNVLLEEKEEEDEDDSGNEDTQIVTSTTSSIVSKENDDTTPPPETPIPFSAITPLLSTKLDGYIAKWKYKARDGDELEMAKGDIVNVLSRETRWGPDWWKGQIDDRVGLFPKTYVVPLTKKKK